jgi:hypothetical protein
MLLDTRVIGITDELVLVLRGLDQAPTLVREFYYVSCDMLERGFYVRDVFVPAVAQIYKVSLTLV